MSIINLKNSNNESLQVKVPLNLYINNIPKDTL